ncbi:hypothetical protein K7X08_002932 [Anisodus acutangulus]|uniref:HMA domain-containing protein n=1 Tax=Anisodus acutangulus TaxID=402998 RepID=A0A9Q1RHG2_9SOLA|nr:hypothetical protein K7X08_002932 [Anisodus acutangulus]
MGLGGTLEYISDIMSSDKPKKKKKQFNTVELKVRMDCDGCELKVKNAVFHEWSEISGDKQETTKGDSNRICGSKQGVKEGKVNREEGRDMAICPLQLGCPALCCAIL